MGTQLVRDMKDVDSEIEHLKLKKLQKLMSSMKKREMGKRDSKSILKPFLSSRAITVLGQAEKQFPLATRRVVELLVKLVNAGVIKSQITGEEMLWLFRRLGLPVRMKMKIKYLKGGKLESLEERFRKEIKR